MIRDLMCRLRLTPRLSAAASGKGNMEITDVSTVLLRVPGKVLGKTKRVRTASLVVVETDVGLKGLGEPHVGIRVPELVPPLVDFFRASLVGEDPMQIDPLCRKMQLSAQRWGNAGLAAIVIAGLEMALWDLKGKALKVPVYELLGGLSQDKLRLYASTTAPPWPPEQVGEFIKPRIDQGFTAVKLGTGFSSQETNARVSLRSVMSDEVRKMEAVRRAVGDDVDLALDHVGSWKADCWSVDTAIRVVTALEDFDLLFVEQPCPSHNVEAYSRVRTAVRTPIAGGEDLTAIRELRAYLDKGALDIVQPDVAWMPLNQVLKAIDLVEGTELRVCLHVGGTAVMRAASYHVAFAKRACFMTEVHNEKNPLFEELLVEDLDIRDGYLYPMTASGLGVRLPDRFVSQYGF